MFNKTLVLFGLVVLLLHVMSSQARAQDSIDLTTRWKPPIIRENGDTLTPEEIAGYKVYRVQGTELTVVATVTSGVTHQLVVPAGECFTLYVTAVDTDNLESKPSTSITRCASLPDAPTMFEIVVP